MVTIRRPVNEWPVSDTFVTRLGSRAALRRWQATAKPNPNRMNSQNKDFTSQKANFENREIRRSKPLLMERSSLAHQNEHL
jgi:hypothetical protein